MAMGNYCWREGIECQYATVTGQCQDDIAEDFGLCEMHGDIMPPKNLNQKERQEIAIHILGG